MRNEIFNRIKQNRIDYYSELNNDKKRTIINLEPLSDKKKLSKEDSPKTNIQLSLLRRISINKNSLHSLLFNNVRHHLFNLMSQIKSWIRKTHSHLANKAAIQSNRLTDGLIRVSSQLFEDRYEYHESSAKPNHIDQRTGYQSINLGLLNTSGVTSTLTFEPNKLSLQDQLFNWLNKLYRNIILFLESDDWLDEINRSQKTTIKSLENNKICSDNKNKRIYQTFRFKKRITNQGVKNHPIHDSETESYQDSSKRFNLFFTDQLKRLSIALFPTINRFI
jgi:hypothetical protein